MSNSTIRLSVEGSVATITLNRPDKLNALNAQVLDELFAVVSELDARDVNERPRVLVLKGAGERAFAAGADIAELSRLGSAEALELSEAGHRLGRALDGANFPCIAAVHGFALGGGLELALSADLIVCSDNARFGQPEINLGVIPGFGGTFRLTARVGIGWARRLIYTGETIDASTAERIKLVDAVFPQADFATQVAELARSIAAKAPLAVAAAKRSLQNNLFESFPSAAEFESRQFSELFATADAREGLEAFLAKRPPCFVGR